MIEPTIYAKLVAQTSLTVLVSDRIYPTVAEENIPELPFVLYKVTNTEPQLVLGGMSGTKRYSVEVDVYGRNKADVDAVASKTTVALTFIAYPVLGSFPTAEASEEVELGYHTNQLFTVWANI